MSQNVETNLGHPTPPSIKRVDFQGWLGASVVAGAMAGVGALIAVWRPLPWLPAPVGGLSDHAAFWAKVAAHHFLPILFSEDARFYRHWWQELGAAGRLAI